MNMIDLTVNGRKLYATAEPRTHLADFLRESHNLTGTHIGCEHGVCGACTILVDGVPARSCITLAVACQHAEITTVEGLDEDEIAVELRAAFSREHALQCGYCTPGMMMSARDVVLRMEAPSEHDIRVAMSGNLCRCTGYVGIVRAVQSVVEARRARGIGAVAGGNRQVLGPAGSGHAGPISSGGPVRPAIAASASGASPRAANPAAGFEAAWIPQTTFTRSFVVDHSVDMVWDFFGRTSEVASCLPGATLAGEPVDGHVEGHMNVKVGPISAEFQGVADIARDDETRTGTITGSGKDRRSNSATRGLVAYVVKQSERPGQTRVDVTIGYTLTGMLAQFGRLGLVEDVANRLVAAFAQNLEARLAGGTGGGGHVSELNAGSLVGAVVMSRIKTVLARLFGRRK
ncbi:MAG TPA: 2Fe-2S iron-sulfur cluster-binding protein [Rhizobiaceae bacterium]|nr:2Fe-2S iron-sulfur cluster-binding protein [Rhizobiaceae bacterium]